MKHLVVIPAAGSGARFHELGKQYPKCLLPYRGRTILDHLLTKIHADLAPVDVRVVVRGEDLLENQLWEASVRGRAVLETVDPSLPQGPATSLFCGVRDVDLTDTRVTVVLSDMYLENDFPLPRAGGRNDVLFGYDGVVDPSRWCFVVEGTEFVEKPAVAPQGGVALLGVYSFVDGWELRRALSQQVHSAGFEPQFSGTFAGYFRLRSEAVGVRTETVPRGQVVDLGTLEEYLRHRTGAAPRHFNTVTYDDPYRVTKRCQTDREKVRLEAAWLSHPPRAYRGMTPTVLSEDPGGGAYTMGRITGHNLRHLALYYDKSERTWDGLFAELWRVLSETRLATVVPGEYWAGVLHRIRSRCDGLPTPSGLLPDLEAALAPLADQTSPYHGDLHLANIFLDSPLGGCVRLKVVDPRGEYWGHWLYDVAKLAHSVLGRYDYVDEGLYAYGSADGVPTYYDRGHEAIERSFRREILERISPEERRVVKLLTAALFASMRPLHEDPDHRRLFGLECQRIYGAKPPW